MPATKHDYGDGLGTLTQHNFEFLRKLWANGSTLRQDLFGIEDENRLRQLLKTEYHVIVDDDVRIVLVDIENAKMKTFAPQLDPERNKFYALVLPPRPRAFPDNRAYQAMQGWNAAHYHAINDSYGM